MTALSKRNDYWETDECHKPGVQTLVSLFSLRQKMSRTPFKNLLIERFWWPKGNVAHEILQSLFAKSFRGVHAIGRTCPIRCKHNSKKVTEVPHQPTSAPILSLNLFKPNFYINVLYSDESFDIAVVVVRMLQKEHESQLCKNNFRSLAIDIESNSEISCKF